MTARNTELEIPTFKIQRSVWTLQFPNVITECYLFLYANWTMIPSLSRVDDNRLGQSAW